MGQGIGGGLPRDAYLFEAIPRYENRRTFYRVESHVEVDRTASGAPRKFRNRATAENRADALNRERAAIAAQAGEVGNGR